MEKNGGNTPPPTPPLSFSTVTGNKRANPTTRRGAQTAFGPRPDFIWGLGRRAPRAARRLRSSVRVDGAGSTAAARRRRRTAARGVRGDGPTGGSVQQLGFRVLREEAQAVGLGVAPLDVLQVAAVPAARWAGPPRGPPAPADGARRWTREERPPLAPPVRRKSAVPPSVAPPAPPPPSSTPPPPAVDGVRRAAERQGRAAVPVDDVAAGPVVPARRADVPAVRPAAPVADHAAVGPGCDEQFTLPGPRAPTPAESAKGGVGSPRPRALPHARRILQDPGSPARPAGPCAGPCAPQRPLGPARPPGPWTGPCARRRTLGNSRTTRPWAAPARPARPRPPAPPVPQNPKSLPGRRSAGAALLSPPTWPRAARTSSERKGEP